VVEKREIVELGLRGSDSGTKGAPEEGPFPRKRHGREPGPMEGINFLVVEVATAQRKWPELLKKRGKHKGSWVAGERSTEGKE